MERQEPDWKTAPVLIVALGYPRTRDWILRLFGFVGFPE